MLWGAIEFNRAKASAALTPTAITIILLLLGSTLTITIHSAVLEERSLPNRVMLGSEDIHHFWGNYNETIEKFLSEYNKTLLDLYNNTIVPELNSTLSAVIESNTSCGDGSLFLVLDNATTSVLSKYLDYPGVNFTADGDGVAPGTDYSLNGSCSGVEFFAAEMPTVTRLSSVTNTFDAFVISESTNDQNATSASSEESGYFKSGRMRILLVYVKFKRTFSSGLEELLHNLEINYHKVLQLIALCPTLMSYFPEVSYGYIPRVEIDVTWRWYQLPYTKSHYVRNYTGLVLDTIKLIDPDYHLPKYDIIGIIHDGGYTWDPKERSAAWACPPFQRKLDGRWIWVRAICCSVEHPPRIFAHEIGHQIGFPDTYITDMAEEYEEEFFQIYQNYHLIHKDPFCVMSAGALRISSLDILSSAIGSYPVHYTAFNKFQTAKWGYDRHVFSIDLEDYAYMGEGIVESINVTLNPLATSLLGCYHYHAVEIRTGNESIPYLYIEARERVNWDRGIPSKGILLHLVLHCKTKFGRQLRPYLVDIHYQTSSPDDASLQVGEGVTVVIF